MHPDPSEIQKLTERVETLEKQVLEWKILYEERKKGGYIAMGIGALFLILYVLGRR